MANETKILKYSDWLAGGYSQFCRSTPSSPNNNRCYPMSSTPLKSDVQGAGSYTGTQCKSKSFWDALYFAPVSIGDVTVTFSAYQYTENNDSDLRYTSSDPINSLTHQGDTYSVGTSQGDWYYQSSGRYTAIMYSGNQWQSGWYTFAYIYDSMHGSYTGVFVMFQVSSSQASQLNGGQSLTIAASHVKEMLP